MFISKILSVFTENLLLRDQIADLSINQLASNAFDESDRLADFAGAVVLGKVLELQDVLERLIVGDWLCKALLVHKKVLINAQLQSKLARDTGSKIANQQWECCLTDQLKGIKTELGMESDRSTSSLKRRAAELSVPEVLRKVILVVAES